MQGFHGILEPTVPLSRHIFKAPTRFYKTGVVFLAWLNGLQDHFVMVGGQESARSLLHLAELFRLADKARVLHDPELAAARMTQAARGARAGVSRPIAAPNKTPTEQQHIEGGNMMIRIMTLAAAAVVALAGAASAQNYPWKPEKPITIIVPWAAGGSTDQVTRVAAAEIEKALGQKIVVVNQPGASGSIGTRNALQAPPDGYTWTAGAAKDLGTYVGQRPARHQDRRLAALSQRHQRVGARRQHQHALQDRAGRRGRHEGEAGPGLGRDRRHQFVRPLRRSRRSPRALGLTYKHVSYDGGNPAVIATVAGETEITTQLAVEQAQMIRGKRLRPLAVLSDKPLELEGFGTIPPITVVVAGFKPDANYFGIFVPKAFRSRCSRRST